ncbi:MAG TPA: alkaline phosphatase family protein, partial [Gemmatimonadaceae bacterium]|nr:alkaline phosphatase family protein [Gemmatimonadaceae bacterium]
MSAPESPVNVTGAGPAVPPRPRTLLGWYYRLKYSLFRRERRAAGRRGLVVLQIDALSHADLRRAIDLGLCPTITKLIREEGYGLRHWYCGLPSATPYCQAGIMYGENGRIPAFRFYDKKTRRVVTCNAPQGVQYIRDRIQGQGALYGGSSYVNLLDGDARTVAFTVATRERLSVYRRLGGTRMALLILIHPIRVLRMAGQAVLEWLREEWERNVGELARRRTHSEGIFPFVRILTNVVVRELQTMAILLDVYLGVPLIYSTFMQYDELAHHFGPSSRAALRDLRRTDARIAEILRMMRSRPGREYDLVILSDHGMTPAASYRVEFDESLGATVQGILDKHAARQRREAQVALASFAESSEYAEVGARVLDTVAGAAPTRARLLRRALARTGRWLRRQYGLREIILPEKYHVGTRHDVVVTYSSSLALVYFADADRALDVTEIEGDVRRDALRQALVDHPGIGIVLARDGEEVVAMGKRGRSWIRDGQVRRVEGEDPLTVYGTESFNRRAIESLVKQPNGGDLVL